MSDGRKCPVTGFDCLPCGGICELQALRSAPTETPAPLSPEGLIRALRTCRGITQHEQDCIRNAANTLVAANTRIAEVEAERDLILAGFNEAQALAAEQKARAEAAESTIARHVAALQEIGKGVEVDQAIIARLTEQLEDAESDADNDRAAWAAAREGTRQVRALFAKHAGIEERMDWRDWIVATEAHLSTIARLRAELAQADAVIADEDGDVLMEDRILWRNQAIARHVARHDTERREG